MENKSTERACSPPESNDHNAKQDVVQPGVYQIRVKGHLGREWMHWFDGMTITLEEDGNTLLTGSVIDQATLHGLLKKVRDLGMPLHSINSVRPNQQDGADIKYLDGEVEI